MKKILALLMALMMALSCFAAVAERYGHIDVLVNCACFGAGYGLGL